MAVPLRLVFFGSDAIALPLLRWIVADGAFCAQVAGVFTQPDRASGRGQQVQPNAIKLWALEHGLPVYQPEKITDAVRIELTALAPDVGLIMAYGHILRDDFIAIPRLGMLNLHTSLLPKYRGASPIQTAVACGERTTGVSLMRVVRRLDAGPVADAEPVAIRPLDTAADVEANLSAAGVPLLARTLPRLAADTLSFVEQDDRAATFCRKLQKEDGALDFNRPAAVLAARINGLFPWPTCSVDLGGQPVKVGLADIAPAEPSAGASGSTARISPGNVLGSDAEGLLVGTGEGVVRFRRLQRPGGKMLPAADFLRGFPVVAGTQISSRLMPALLVPPK